MPGRKLAPQTGQETAYLDLSATFDSSFFHRPSELNALSELGRLIGHSIAE